ncbi:hypothetical protein AB0K74_24625 [Streptomyces sp. NPDC056159]|uniref:hypothetical protein n=1 Tax=unclassified Streptomyces TaxID=2593676 RepID=UPI003449711D
MLGQERAARIELPDLATRLLVERPAVFDRYDRLLAEASIRINMFLPVVAFVTTPALHVSWLWRLGLIVCVALLDQGLVQRSWALAVALDSVGHPADRVTDDGGNESRYASCGLRSGQLVARRGLGTNSRG